jgi:hypothetical protein
VNGELSRRVGCLCADAIALGDPSVAAQVERVAAMLGGPLRVAVAGRVNAGKSTLVNALLRRRVAPTKPTECTQFATWYHYGTPERADVSLRDGTVRHLQLAADGRLPSTVGVPPEAVDRLDVFLSEAVLRELTIIDTPGLASLNEANSERTEDLLTRSTAASDRAEAVLFVFAVSLRADERDILRDFRDASASVAHHSPVNALGVLSKIDALTDPDEDPWPMAERLAGEFAGRLSHELGGVIPVAALMAETVEGGAFTETDATTIAALAALDSRQRRRLLRSVDAFAKDDVPVSVEARLSLRDRLDLYGINVAVDLVTRGSTGAVALKAALAERSRITLVRNALATTFARRADALKASWALGQLRLLVHDSHLPAASRIWLADRLEEVLLDPGMHRMAVIEALDDVATSKAFLPPELASALTALADGATPAERLALPAEASEEEVEARARELCVAFTVFAFDAFPADAHVARVGARACHLISDAVAASAPAASTFESRSPC